MEVAGRAASIDLSPQEFRAIGHRLIDEIADFLASLPDMPVARRATVRDIRQILGSESLPQTGTDPGLLLKEATTLLFSHSSFNGHPRFMAYITSSAAPLGMLADLLATAVNPNVGAWSLSPIATEIEAQTVRWLAELLGMPSGTGGLLVSGGNTANFVCFLAARRAKAPWDVQAGGLTAGKPLCIYASEETHTWVVKAADMFGHGTNAIRWIPTDKDLAMDVGALETRIEGDLRQGSVPFLVVGAAGTVSTGAVDPLERLADTCRTHGIWFHVDGAYGAPAVVTSNAPKSLAALSYADSVAVDPHKWLYAPMEAGCALVRNAQALHDAFSHHPPYYHFDHDEEPRLNYHEYGPQNSRGFRALKVWLGLRHVGRDGYARLISENIELSQELSRRVAAEPELEAWTQSLSICTFRYVPADMEAGTAEAEEYLNRLNEALLGRIEQSGEAFLSNAVIRGSYLLRSCIVNFRTCLSDIEALPGIITRLGRQVDHELRRG
ncbi:MAG TPA: aminotransferase class V-fold PLP-dependent enzyme [Chloroflexota bacterium]|jgi:glutamate/tyrosine decarboxylase-like PLP-dependent enzyme|nr:aminotransferase class V-fold PLP-dependent enzyme [Chloroflexota bacterium]